MWRALLVWGLLCLVCADRPAAADEPLPAETLKALKSATVLVKQRLGPIEANGSGFVINRQGDSCLIVTNEHVIHAPEVGEIEKYLSLILRTRPLTPSQRQQVEEYRRQLHEGKNELSVVFYSDSPSEQVAAVEVLAADEEADLAVLKVVGVKQPPAPLDYKHGQQFGETTTVYIVGFPFGEMLSMTSSKANPAVTVAKGSISSLRHNDVGELAYVQIDGAVNHGNSGGPIVDGTGKLVGVAVKRISDSHIGLAIPPGEVLKVLAGKPGKLRPTLSASKEQEMTFTVAADLVDPLKKVVKAELLYVRRDAAAGDKPKTLVGESGCQQAALSLEGKPASFSIAWPLQSDVKEVTVDAQVVVTLSGGQTVASHVERANWSRSSLQRGTTNDPRPLAGGRTPRNQPGVPPPGFVPPPGNGPITTDEDVRAALEELRLKDLLRSRLAAERLAAVAEPFGPRNEVKQALVEVLQLDGPEFTTTRAAAVVALGRWGDAETVGTIVEYLGRQENPFERRAAISSLGKLGGDAALAAIVRCIGDFHLRQAVCDALRTLGAPAELAVIALLDSDDKDQCRAACDILGKIGTDRCRKALEQVVLGNDFILSTQAKRALKELRIRNQ